MSTKFRTVITTAGAAKLAAATAPGGRKVNITTMAVGDGGGKLPVPDAGQTGLIHEVWRHALNKISQDKRNSNYIIAELVIPPEVGGFWMRELGLYDDAGTLIAVANMAESYKPALAEGSGRSQTCRMVIIVSSVASVALTIDTTTVMATQDYVDDKIAEHEQSRRHPDASLTAKGFTQLSNATNSTSETLAATPKAVKAAYDLANGKYTAQDATTARKGLVQLSSATNSTSETLAATPKAVKTAYDLANGKYTAQDATTARKGLVQLSSATNSDSETLAATPKAVKSAYDNAEKRLQKDQNGADIPDKRLFLRNIGATNSTTMSFSGGTGWFRLATVTMPQASSVVYISLIGGAGYNVNSPMQAGISELVLRAGNGNPKGLTGALWRRTSVGFTNFAWVNTSGDTYDVYVEIGNYATGVNIQWDYTSNASVTIHTSPSYTANKPTGLTDGTVYVIYSSHIKPTAADVGALSLSGGQLNGALGIGTSSALGGNSIVLGDNDTGFKQNGDGNLDVYANNVHVMRFVSGSIQSNKTINITGRVNPTDYGNFDSRYVRDIRLGGAATYKPANNGMTWTHQAPSGCIYSGIIVQDTGSNSADNIGGVYYRPVQKYINGTWYNVAQV
ncbi:TPA: phage tail protein [Escherichia coli]|uniref:tail fiber protein n=1 Tax=Escherichia coli TaxID=562 RepID=UPI0017560ED5|nr:tail fiber protein [Escherichia coli]MCF3425028.1 tail fiber protein [Escherichia coli]MCN6100010.1 tail fiber protein [Escherichia coli]MEC6521829.1 tail fiber protein [Escherichia coli]MEC6548214.1 tail fiber protein [Escherichia coli]QWZ96790.1 phage tail protein [Escherichia coli]